jgi:hypothetical protein
MQRIRLVCATATPNKPASLPDTPPRPE